MWERFSLMPHRGTHFSIGSARASAFCVGREGDSVFGEKRSKELRAVEVLLRSSISLRQCFSSLMFFHFAAAPSTSQAAPCNCRPFGAEIVPPLDLVSGIFWLRRIVLRRSLVPRGSVSGTLHGQFCQGGRRKVSGSRRAWV